MHISPRFPARALFCSTLSSPFLRDRQLTVAVYDHEPFKKVRKIRGHARQWSLVPLLLLLGLESSRATALSVFASNIDIMQAYCLPQGL